ncbi:slipin family protein [Jeongeupia wiesaeckerbachi]|uniref:slipin family protein n=1 Tax=Jeongeupia wiesaeckerbachi TaxID=3051218 RepID=UPI003D802467
MWQRFLVRKNERALLLCNGDFTAVLQPGRYLKTSLKRDYAVVAYPLDEALFEHPLAEYLRQYEPEVVASHFALFDLGDNEAGLRFENEVLVEIVAPGSRRMYWRDAVAQRFERIDLAAGWAVPEALLARIAQPALRGKAIIGLNAILNVQVQDGLVGLLRIDGQRVALLQPGRYAYWRFNRDIAVDLVDTRLQTVEITGQEILTRDKVSLRVNLAANWLFDDVALAFSRLAKPMEHIYRELQFGLRAAVGTRTLDELLENKQVIDDVVSLHMTARLNGFGVRVASLGVKDIVLPGEMKALLAQVVEAEKAAQANVIRRREETGATRSLLNTAKVMEDNPTALRLKELETLERLAERIDKISVIGGFDQLLNGLVSLKT